MYTVNPKIAFGHSLLNADSIWPYKSGGRWSRREYIRSVYLCEYNMTSGLPWGGIVFDERWESYHIHCTHNMGATVNSCSWKLFAASLEFTKIHVKSCTSWFQSYLICLLQSTCRKKLLPCKKCIWLWEPTCDSSW